MKFYSEQLTRGDLEEIARGLGMQLYNVREGGSRKPYVAFVLRPETGGERFRATRPDRYTKTGTRRIWAVCWHGHYQFMLEALTRDPSARIVSAIATWDGLGDFHARAWTSAGRNIGPLASPHLYGECCACSGSDAETGAPSLEVIA